MILKQLFKDLCWPFLGSVRTEFDRAVQYSNHSIFDLLGGPARNLASSKKFETIKAYTLSNGINYRTIWLFDPFCFVRQSEFISLSTFINISTKRQQDM